MSSNKKKKSNQRRFYLYVGDYNQLEIAPPLKMHLKGVMEGGCGAFFIHENKGQ